MSDKKIIIRQKTDGGVDTLLPATQSSVVVHGDSTVENELNVLAAHSSDFSKHKKRKIIPIYREASLPSATMTITGVGFKASKVTAFAVIDGTAYTSIGTQVGTEFMSMFSSQNSGDVNRVTIGQLINISHDGSNSVTATVVSFNEDGCMLFWGKLGEQPTGLISIVLLFEEGV